jgi:hypothetical protein
MFSLEGTEGMRVLTRSRLFSDEEWEVLVRRERTEDNLAGGS